MRIAFVGGHGHHYLQSLTHDPADDSPVVRATGGDGYDDAGAAAWGRNKWPGVPFYRTMDELVKEFKPDVISVGTFFGYNGNLVAKALQKGVSASCDKPMAATWEQLDAIRKLVQTTGLQCVTEFPYRTQRECVAGRVKIEKGEIGKVALVSAQKSYRFGERPAWYADRASYGGTLLWVLSHSIDIIQHVTGQTITRVTGTGGNMTMPKYGTMEDHVAVMLQLSGGATAVAHADYLRPAAAPTHGDDRIRVVGGEGILEIRDDRCRMTTRTQGDTDVTDTVPAGVSGPEQLLAALRGDTTQTFSTANALHVASVLLTCRDAADSQTWLDV